jgi:hypothetical protein
MSIKHKQRLAIVAENLLKGKTCFICRNGGAASRNKWWCDDRMQYKERTSTCSRWERPSEMPAHTWFHP